MPRMSGHQLLDCIRQNPLLSEVLLVLMSADNTVPVSEQKGSTFISKPIRSKDLPRIWQNSKATISKATRPLRRVVGGSKKRFQQDGFDLNLSYICPNLIAMGLPAEGRVEGLYRNPIQEVASFFDTFHKEHFMIYNLCMERTYDAKHFGGKVRHYPFADHQPSPLALMFDFCADLESWLGSHPSNVAAVHCRGGKGRTGTMVC